MKKAKFKVKVKLELRPRNGIAVVNEKIECTHLRINTLTHKQSFSNQAIRN